LLELLDAAVFTLGLSLQSLESLFLCRVVARSLQCRHDLRVTARFLFFNHELGLFFGCLQLDLGLGMRILHPLDHLLVVVFDAVKLRRLLVID